MRDQPHFCGSPGWAWLGSSTGLRPLEIRLVAPLARRPGLRPPRPARHLGVACLAASASHLDAAPPCSSAWPPRGRAGRSPTRFAGPEQGRELRFDRCYGHGVARSFMLRKTTLRLAPACPIRTRIRHEKRSTWPAPTAKQPANIRASAQAQKGSSGGRTGPASAPLRHVIALL
jgi:hypothetical protein